MKNQDQQRNQNIRNEARMFQSEAIRLRKGAKIFREEYNVVATVYLEEIRDGFHFGKPFFAFGSILLEKDGSQCPGYISENRFIIGVKKDGWKYVVQRHYTFGNDGEAGRFWDKGSAVNFAYDEASKLACSLSEGAGLPLLEDTSKNIQTELPWNYFEGRMKVSEKLSLQSLKRTI